MDGNLISRARGLCLAVALTLVLGLPACADGNGSTNSDRDPGDLGGGKDDTRSPSGAPWEDLRSRMVAAQIRARGVSDPRILEAMASVPRHLFVPEAQRPFAYEDRPLPIGHQQTISQPYVVAAMTEALRPAPDDVILEVGTGSGYQAAVLSKLVKRVFSIEIVEPLGRAAEKTLADQGFDNVTVIVGDGYRGLPDEAPFDGIIVTAAPAEVPPPLLEQLAPGGRLVIPVGRWAQDLQVMEKTADGVVTQSLFPVRFVPMTGEAEK